jgi:hypothetical protein
MEPQRTAKIARRGYASRAERLVDSKSSPADERRLLANFLTGADCF